MEGLKPYPSYKDSGIEWLGKVPKNWEIIRSKYLFICIDVRSKTGQEELLTVSSEKGIIPRKSATVTMFKAASYVGYKLCWPGDLVINSLWAWARGLGVSIFHGIISTAYGVYRPVIDIDTKYLHELVRSKAFHWELRVRSKGIWTSRLQLTDDSFLNTKLPFPPITEQVAIARYLNYIDRRIKRYINSKERLIKLLEEQKQDVIHQAVTGQIDVRTGKPYPKYKDSGVEWLGRVPEGWEVRRCKYIFSEVDKRSAKGEEQHLSMSQKLGLVPDHFVDNRTLTSESYANGKLCKNGDIVLNRLKAHLGVFALSKYEGIVSPDYTVLRTLIEGYSAYYEKVLRSPATRGELYIRAKGIVEGFWRLYTDDLFNIRLPVPTREECVNIVSYIDKIDTKINNIMNSTKTQISLMKEYRTRLIADVVTGKVDVREIAEGLPEEPIPEEAEVS